MVLILLTALSVASCSPEGAAIAAGSTAVWAFAGIWIFFVAIFWGIGIFLFVVWIIMLVDCVKRENNEFPNAGESTKTMWLLIIILTGGVGAIIYYFLVKKKIPRKA